MENHTDDLKNVVDYRIQLGILGLCFLLGLIINIPAAVIYVRRKHLRGCTDKFILYVLLVDVLSLLAFIPASFVLILELEARSNKGRLNGGKPNVEERPLFFEDENLLKGSGISVTQSENDKFSSYCVQQWIFVVHKVIFIMAANLSTLGALKIAVERYLAVVSPLHYTKILKSSTVFLVSLISFLFSVLSALIISIVPGDIPTPFLVSQCAENILWEDSPMTLSKEVNSMRLESGGDFDDYASPLKTFQRPTYSKESLNKSSINLWWPVLTLAHATVFFIVPLIVMMFMYLRIWTEARKQTARMAHHNKNAFVVTADVKKSEINVASLQSIVGRFKLVQQIRRKTRMNRAARVATLSIGLLVLSFGPLYYVRIVSALSFIINFYIVKAPSEPVPNSAQSISTGLTVLLPTFLACLHPLLSPFLYIYRYKKVRTELATLLKKMISSFNCRRNDSMDCKEIVQQINQLAEKLPSSSSYDEIIESQSVSNSDIDTTTTIDLQCALSATDEADPVGVDSGHLCGTFHHLEGELEDDIGRQEYSESDIESQECKADSGISSPNHGLLHMFNSWMHSYSRRWNQHRESVTSTASVITLLSNRSRSIP